VNNTGTKEGSITK